MHQPMSTLPPKADMCGKLEMSALGQKRTCRAMAHQLQPWKKTKHLSAFSLGKIRRRKGSVWYFASGSGYVFCDPARNGGDKAITAVLHIHDIFLTDVPKRNT
jgi:hypothetical protein